MNKKEMLGNIEARFAFSIQMRESQERCSAIFDQSPIAIEFYDAAGGLVAVNRACLDLFGVVNEAEVLGFKMFEDPNITDEVKTRLLNKEIVRFAVDFSFDKVKQLKLYETTHSGIKTLDWCISPLIEESLLIGYVMHIQDITERKLAEEAVRKSEENYRLIADNTGDVITVLNMDLQFTYISPSVFQLSGFTVEEVLNKSVDQIVTAGSLSVFVKNFEEELVLEASGNANPQRIRTIEVEEYRKDGSLFWMEINLSFIRNQEGMPLGVIAVIRDVSSRKKTEIALHRSEEMYRLIADNMADVISIIDLNLRFTYVSPSISRLYGIPAEELMNQPIDKLITPKSMKHVLSIFEKEIALEALGTADPQRITTLELEHYWKDATPLFWMEVSSSFLRDQDKKVMGMIAVSRDITERKQTDETLLKERERLKGVIEGTNVGIWEWNVQTGEVVFNDRWAEIIGYSLDEISPVSIETWTKYAHPDDVESSGALLEKHFRGEIGYYEFDSRMKHKDGNWIWVLDRGKVASWTEDGKPLMMMGTHQDITERKRMRKALIEAERLSAIGELSSGVAHDFNNALEVINGNLEMALFVPNIPQEVTELIKRSRKSANDAAARIRQLQRFTKKEQHSEYQPLDLNVVLDEAILQTRPLWKDMAEKKGLQISFQRTHGKIRHVDGDLGEFGSAFHNLIKNAIEAMPIGGVINIETGMIGEKVFVRIGDAGIGMDDEIKKRIFQPFFSTKGLEPGRGLGMSAVASIVSDHGGVVYVKETIVGKGTTIEMLLPVGTLRAIEVKIIEPSVQKDLIRVLWVDDEEAIRTLGRMYMEKLGYFSDIANGGLEALELLRNNHYDLVISDIGMPGMDGWQLAEAIKNTHPEVKVVIVSGWGSEAGTDKKIRYGVSHILGKPTSMNKLKEMIGAVFQSKM